jgi:hypothetical protein
MCKYVLHETIQMILVFVMEGLVLAMSWELNLCFGGLFVNDILCAILTIHFF